MKAAQAKEKEVIFVERILVIGCPGAGKSSFARRLREITGLPLYYLDMIWHRLDRTTVAREEFDRRLEQMARYEENLYLKAVLEGVGNSEIPIHELSGFDHGGVVSPACLLIKGEMSR